MMITTGAEIKGVTRLSNKTINIKLNTQELSPDKTAQLLAMSDYVMVAFKNEHFNTEEQEMLENVKTDSSINKSSSQRLRNTLYILYKQNDQGYSDFIEYYKAEMEKLINSFKKQIE